MKSHKDVKTNRCSTLRFFEEVTKLFQSWDIKPTCARFVEPFLKKTSSAMEQSHGCVIFSGRTSSSNSFSVRYPSFNAAARRLL